MSTRTRKNVGVIGLGMIGQRVAENLRQRGFHVFVWNRTPRPVPNFVGSPGEVAELCDFVQIFVSDDEALLHMAHRIKTNLTPQHIVMAHSTVSPETMRAIAEIVQRRGAQFLDAPFTGSKTAAENGQLVYYLGGNEATIQQARPVLEASSKEIVEIGGIGDATIIKVATNMVTAATVQAAAEALALVHQSGVAVDKFTAAMRNNGSNSPTLDMKLPMMVEGNFERNFSVKHMLKDIEIATRLARSLDLEFRATDAARHGLIEQTRQGRDDDDYSSVIRSYFPDGKPLRREEQIQDSEREDAEEDHPQLAGIDDEKLSTLVAERTAPVSTVEPAPGLELANAESETAAEIPELATTKSLLPVAAPDEAKVEDKSADVSMPQMDEQAESAPLTSTPDAGQGETASGTENSSVASTPEEPASPAEPTPEPGAASQSSTAAKQAEEHRGLGLGRFWRRQGDQ